MNKKNVSEFIEVLSSNYPKADVMAILELDCGCAKLIGYTKKGEECTPLFTLSKKPIENGEATICLGCLKDSTGVGRELKSYLVWKDGVKLSNDEQTSIANKAFGI